LELVWTLIPAVVLVMLALYQMNVWRSQRVARPETDVAGVGRIPAPPLVRVVARQFGWEFHYAGRDQRSGTGDDFSVENLIVLPDDQPIVLSLESRDVIHSFFVPQLRLKHDVVPGMTHYAWFTPTRTGTMSVVCAELCGWGHTRMTGELRIVSRREFEDWQRIEQDRIDGAAD
jgi:cytochrome c oxidase subunit 2